MVVPKILYYYDHRLISTHAGGFDWRLGLFRDTYGGRPDGPATNRRRDGPRDGELLLRARAAARRSATPGRSTSASSCTTRRRTSSGARSERGYRVRYEPSAVIYHRESGVSGGGWMTPFKQYYATRNRIYLVRKHAHVARWRTPGSRRTSGRRASARPRAWRAARVAAAAGDGAGHARLLPRPHGPHDAGARPVRIAIDATSMPPQPAGAGVYAIELVRAMAERDRHDGYALFTRGAWFDDARRRQAQLARRARRRAGRAARRAGVGAGAAARGARAPRHRRAALDASHAAAAADARAARRHGARRDVLPHPRAIPARPPALHADARRGSPRASPTRSSCRRAPCATTCIACSRVAGVEAARRVRGGGARSYRAGGREARCAVARDATASSGRTCSASAAWSPARTARGCIRAMRAAPRRRHRRALVDRRPAGVDVRGGAARSSSELGMRDRVRFLGYVPQERPAGAVQRRDGLRLPVAVRGLRRCRCSRRWRAARPCSRRTSPRRRRSPATRRCSSTRRRSTRSARGCAACSPTPSCATNCRARASSAAAQFSWRRAADETHAVYERALAGESEPA